MNKFSNKYLLDDLKISGFNEVMFKSNKVSDNVIEVLLTAGTEWKHGGFYKVMMGSARDYVKGFEPVRTLNSWICDHSISCLISRDMSLDPKENGSS